LALHEADLREVIDDGSEEPGSNRKVEDGIRDAGRRRPQGQLTGDAPVRGRIVEVACDVMDPLGEPVTRRLVEI
jgi:hypothetical protein